MPRVRVNGINLFCEVAGRGPAVALISGLGADGHFWHKQVSALSSRYQVITVDNRGAGRSDKPKEPYTIRLMADDLSGLLDALELPTAHLIGASMGGFVAQEFALAYPQRTGKLVLCCTSFGGPRSEPIPMGTLQLLTSRTGDPERDLRAFLEVQFATAYMRTHAEEIEAYVAWRVAHPQPLHAYHQQLMAGMAHDASDRLPAVRVPVLVLHGIQDRVVPVHNAELLAAALPGARLHLFANAGHLFLWEHAQEANRMIMEFLGGGPDDGPTFRAQR